MFGQNRNISLCQYGRSFVRSLYLFDIEVVIPTTFHTTPPPIATHSGSISAGSLPIVDSSRSRQIVPFAMINGSYGSNDRFYYEERNL
jgi:hypothetical protein